MGSFSIYFLVSIPSFYVLSLTRILFFTGYQSGDMTLDSLSTF